MIILSYLTCFFCFSGAWKLYESKSFDFVIMFISWKARRTTI